MVGLLDGTSTSEDSLDEDSCEYSTDTLFRRKNHVRKPIKIMCPETGRPKLFFRSFVKRTFGPQNRFELQKTFKSTQKHEKSNFKRVFGKHFGRPARNRLEH